ncbi:MAG: hypothetical protein LWY06_02550 [Firmicutes bacterium]|nr:hypothetical protein [Bacillota bacterium]
MKHKIFRSVLIAALMMLTTLAVFAATPKTGFNYVASSAAAKKVFHLPTCKWASKIKQSNAVYFVKREDAVKQGYKPCGVCKP